MPDSCRLSSVVRIDPSVTVNPVNQVLSFSFLSSAEIRTMATSVISTRAPPPVQSFNREQLAQVEVDLRQISSSHTELSTVDKVKRCLFGDVDHQTVRHDLAALRRQLDEHSRRRWNFDFRSGTPLMTSLPASTAAPGDAARWLWTRVCDRYRDTL